MSLRFGFAKCGDHEPLPVLLKKLFQFQLFVCGRRSVPCPKWCQRLGDHVMLIRITILRCSVECPNFRPFKSVYLQSLHYFNQGFCRIRFVNDVHKKILLSKGERAQSLLDSDGGTWDNVHERGYPSYLSNSFPLLTPVRFPMHHYVDGPISVIYFDNEALI